jgi:hypothetical protein
MRTSQVTPLLVGKLLRIFHRQSLSTNSFHFSASFALQVTHACRFPLLGVCWSNYNPFSRSNDKVERLLVKMSRSRFPQSMEGV